MSVRTRLAAFALALAGAFGAGSALGAAVGPLGTGETAPAPHEPGNHGQGHP